MLRPEGLSPIDGTRRMAVLGALRLIPKANFATKKLAKPANERLAGDERRAGRNGFRKVLFSPEAPGSDPATTNVERQDLLLELCRKVSGINLVGTVR
jgi:hypothetical protein